MWAPSWNVRARVCHRSSWWVKSFLWWRLIPKRASICRLSSAEGGRVSFHPTKLVNDLSHNAHTHSHQRCHSKWCLCVFFYFLFWSVCAHYRSERAYVCEWQVNYANSRQYVPRHTTGCQSFILIKSAPLTQEHWDAQMHPSFVGVNSGKLSERGTRGGREPPVLPAVAGFQTVKLEFCLLFP